MKGEVTEFEEAVATPPPEGYYNQAKKEYLIKNGEDEWMPRDTASYRLLLRAAGLDSRPASGERISPVDTEIVRVQQDRSVHYAGRLAGYQQGIHTFGATRVLVTISPKLIKPVSGEWETLRTLLDGLLGDTQLQHLKGWLKIAYEALSNGRIRPGQVVAFCGPHNCGKSLVQNLITEILGGSVAKPYQFMRGGTEFNADLFGAEHLMIEDEQPSADIRARRAFGSAIKIMTVAETQRLHAKGTDALVLKPFWRVTVSLNDEDENVQVLPPMDDSISDKLMLFKAVKRDPMPTVTPEQRTAFWGTLIAELPGFIHHLSTWEIPPAMRCERFGVTHYHHPDILEALDASAPETRCQDLIDGTFFTEPGDQNNCVPHQEVKKTHREIEDAIRAAFPPEAARLFSWANACGTYLGRLSTRRSARVVSCRDSDVRRWRLIPPRGPA